MPKTIGIDTNILIYLHDSSSPAKRAIAKELLASSPKVSSQIVSEYLNTCRRILTLDKTALLLQAAGLFKGCPIIPVTSDTISYAADLTVRYKFQLFDAVIVANCIQSNCEILYSEDMQHGLVVDKLLTIINPFV